MRKNIINYRAKISQLARKATVAEYLRIARSTYSGYENAWSDIPTEILIALARYYGVSADYLLGMTDETKPYPPAKKR